jgi:hypothetical protein
MIDTSVDGVREHATAGFSTEPSEQLKGTF